ncbi:STAS domain-containing protein [Rhodopirellula sp. MGV]|uniref:STAS domain-containing protein n=1 Tax=Rhodopirellula sp. MGV TaxID=2023130 RepID=UPI000B9728E7|nr:STAS domain-containing protein [Rhodopirellula sp. MGV]OYP37460.1 hypothetical protein CGZ80_04850 [Rhodopirellula sp. MGV]PNY37862.1 anti-sigma factor antagonist [Rhodopirellula baltica]
MVPSRREKTDIRLDDSVLVVAPTTKSISTRKHAKYFSADVAEHLTPTAVSRLRRVVIDLSGVQWVSSAGLNELIHLHSLARSAGTEMHLLGVCEAIRDVLRITRLERIFDVELSSWESASRSAEELNPSAS